jgi:histidinol-phosphate/aromatic aminotransferase/cobyric acid decarboxylase-like protein
MTSAAQHGKGRLQADRQRAICCDVLDAWFDPSPSAITAFSGSGLAMRTSPEADGRGLIDAIAEARGIDPECISLGAGSSEIMYRVLSSLYGDGPTVILDPTYSEYPHLLRRDGREIRAVCLSRANGFKVCVEDLITACEGASLVILVNPNNPTGQALTRHEIINLKASLSPSAILWVDEAYIDYCPPGTSVEADACRTEGLYVLKSLSKAYALSGVRAAYLVCPGHISARLKSQTPPWIIGTSAQAASAAAVLDREYNAARWAESAVLLSEFATAFRGLGLTVYSGNLNAVMVEVPAGHTAISWARCLASKGLIVRTPEGMGEALDGKFIRIGLVEKAMHPMIRTIIESSLYECHH